MTMLRTHVVAPLALLGDYFVVSPDVRSKILALAKVMEPYELYAATVDWDQSPDRMAFIQLLEADGAFSKDVLQAMETAGEAIYGQCKNMVTEHEKKGFSFQKHARESRRFDNATNNMRKQLAGQNRFLACLMLEEACRYSLTRNIGELIRVVGEDKLISQVCEEVRSGNEPVEAGIIIDWYNLAWRSTSNKVWAYPWSKDITPNDAYTYLKEIELEPISKGKGPRFRFPWELHGVGRLSFEIFVPEDLDPIYLACFRAYSTDHQFIVEWAMTRNNAQLVSQGGHFVSLLPIFVHYKREKLYTYLTQHCIHCLMGALLKGTLKEQSWVTIKESDSTTAMFEETEPETESTVIEPVVEETAELATNIEQTAIFQALISPTKLGPFTHGSLAWRKIVPTLRRCGVSVEFGGKHLKLNHNGKTSTFVNSHSRDSRKNRWILFECLKQLDISRATFFQNYY